MTRFDFLFFFMVATKSALQISLAVCGALCMLFYDSFLVQQSNRIVDTRMHNIDAMSFGAEYEMSNDKMVRIIKTQRIAHRICVFT